MVRLQLPNPNNGDSLDSADTPHLSEEDFDSACSTPYVSAPSSPGRGGNMSIYFFSAPTSPMHYILSAAQSPVQRAAGSSSSSSDFEFSSRLSSSGSPITGSMSSVDELFSNGKIKPMKLSSHLKRPQILDPLIDLEGNREEEEPESSVKRGRDLKLRSRSLHRKARSLSPLRNPEFQLSEEISSNRENEEEKAIEIELVAESRIEGSASSSVSGRNSKKWIFLKDLLYRSKSEGRGNPKEKEKLWSLKERKLDHVPNDMQKDKEKKHKQKDSKQVPAKRRVPLSAHELHYTAKRAQAEEMKKRTYLPYRQGVFGCLGFSSKGYGVFNGLARSLNPVPSK